MTQVKEMRKCRLQIWDDKAGADQKFVRLSILVCNVLAVHALQRLDKRANDTSAHSQTKSQVNM